MKPALFPARHQSTTARWALVFLFLLLGIRASAATFTVSNTDDSCDCSLRYAITQANASSGADLINFRVLSPEDRYAYPTEEKPKLVKRYEPQVRSFTAARCPHPGCEESRFCH